jgi:hypothetical protein
MSLTQTVKSRPASRSGLFEKMLAERRISKGKYAELQELRDSWRNGEIAVGIHITARDVSQFVKQEIAPSTLNHWLGRKGSNVT